MGTSPSLQEMQQGLVDWKSQQVLHMSEAKYVLAYLQEFVSKKIAKKYADHVNQELLPSAEASRLGAALKRWIAEQISVSASAQDAEANTDKASVPQGGNSAAVSLPQPPSVSNETADNKGKKKKQKKSKTALKSADTTSGVHAEPQNALDLNAKLNAKLKGKALYKDVNKEHAANKEMVKLLESGTKEVDESAAVSLELIPTPVPSHTSNIEAAVAAPSEHCPAKSKSSSKRKQPEALDVPANAILPAPAKVVQRTESAVVTLETIVTAPEAQEPAFKKAKIDVLPEKDRVKKAKNAPFRRVRAEEVEIGKEFLDNSYNAKGGSLNDYGAKAHRDLIVTKGEAFRKEKTKKKRGSYRGGDISLESHSIKFD